MLTKNIAMNTPGADHPHAHPPASNAYSRQTSLQQMEAGVPAMIEEKITSAEGDVTYKKYLRGRFLGKVRP